MTYQLKDYLYSINQSKKSILDDDAAAEKAYPPYIVKCTYCGWRGPRTKEKYFCLDHIIPYVEAPHLAFDVDNIAIACNHCNKKKGNMTIQEFLGTS